MDPIEDESSRSDNGTDNVNDIDSDNDSDNDKDIDEDENVDKDDDKANDDNNDTSSDSRDDTGNDGDNDDDPDDDERDGPGPSNMVYDFDIMMAKKKEENSRKRRRKNYEIINDNDDFIAEMINQMKKAVDDDMEANKYGKAATNKLKQLPFIMSQLRKYDLREAFLDSDVLNVITDWLTPLPDKSLPHLKIREDLLKILLDFNICDVEKIKASAVGKAVMYLYKHPKETRENKILAKKLISSWSRPIFQLDTSFSAISREEREDRDVELMNKHRRQSRKSNGSETDNNSQNKKDEQVPPPLKPGDKGWIPRARVPAPSMKDYVIRPRSTVEGDVGKSSRRPTNMLDKYLKVQQERKRASRVRGAVSMKIDRI